MAVIFNERQKEHELLISLLKKDTTHAPWIVKHLIEILEVDLERQAKKSKCKHEHMKYSRGEKYDCDDCGSYGDTGYFIWETINNTEISTRNSLKNKAAGKTKA